MTKLMEKALEAVRRLPEDRQNEIAEFMLCASEPVKLTAGEQAAIDEGLADLKAGRFVSDEEYQATLKRLRSA